MSIRISKEQVELTGTTKYWAVDTEEGGNFTVEKQYDGNSDYTTHTVFDVDKGEEIKGELADELIEACQEEKPDNQDILITLKACQQFIKEMDSVIDCQKNETWIHKTVRESIEKLEI